MDPPTRYLDSEDAGNQTEVMRKLLPGVTKPIYSCVLDERVPAIVEYPLAEVATSAKCAYLNTTAAYAIAFGLWNKVGKWTCSAWTLVIKRTFTLLKQEELAWSFGYLSASLKESP